ncbi:MAG TPA: glycoside hydrolase family 3 N-terminal domain-containing protein, partial [Beutenbergiaceae bacterium]|nr:glycoside hydrolase family 3 N-terminal domain-containing protein [Beutenbergiaceae bacterium]
LADMAGVPKDEPLWEEFLDQLTLDEQVELFTKGGWQTAEVERLGIPVAKFLDGPAGLNYFFGSFDAAAYPTEVVIAATWNTQLARDVGEAVGQEAAAYGVQGWYAPGMNLHRTAMGGRNFEYFSEDPLLSGTMGAGMIAGAQDQGITVFMKHFVLNDQEINARSGVNVWVDEQALRELYLRPFEIAVKEGHAHGAMTSFIHLGPRWAGGHDLLLTEVLRGEWGFDGLVTTDAVLGGFMDPEQAARAGNDIMLSTVLPGAEKNLRSALEDDPVGLGWALRERVHQILFTVANSSAV